MAGQTLQDILATMNPEILMNMKTAVETGRWANGGKLTPEQVELCLQAIIAYEERHLPEHERTGYIDRTGMGTKPQGHPAPDAPQPLRFRDRAGEDTNGPSGTDGPDGTNGPDGANGPDGTNGKGSPS